VTERVAIVTDLHANLPATKAAFARIEELGIGGIYCGGDLVGYGPHPNEVCALIAERGIPTIYGNYDYGIGRELEDCGCAYRDQRDRELGELSIAWTLANTNAASKAFMRGLPFDVRFDLGGWRIRLVHGSPRKVNEYLFEDKPARTFERIAGLAESDVLVFGHTHECPWAREHGGVLFVNCGSVGKPKDGDPRGSFAVLAESGGGVHVTFERVAYDSEAVAAEMRDVGLPMGLADKLVLAG
jgi:putative phosphoesterase